VDDDALTVVDRELLLLQPAVRQDAERVLALLHPDFMEYGSSGRVWDRSSVTSTTSEATAPIEATHIQAYRLGRDAYLLTYTSNDAGLVALRSSTWLRHDGEWLLRFHQGTVIAAG
jgi:hypothetical protein